MTESDDFSRIRHALCIALDVNPALNEPTYDLLLRLLSSGWRAQKGVNERPHDPALVALLRQAEWAGPTDGNGPSTCPWCGKPEHAPTCPVAPVLYPKEQG